MGFSDDERDLDEVGKKLTRWFADELGPGVSGVRVEDLDAPMGTGFSSDTLLFDLAYESQGSAKKEPLVARLEPEEYIVFPDYDIALQYKVLDLLGPTDVPVPPVRWLEMSQDVLGVPFYIMDRIEGRIPSDNPPMHDEGWIAEDLSESEREALWWSGIEAMGRVHRLDWRTLGFDFLIQPERGETPLDQQLHYYDAYFTWAADRSRHPQVERALDFLQTKKPKDEPTALCWGDSRLANQIFQGTECVSLLDWEMVRLGNPIQDLAWWLASDRCFTEGLEIERLAGFPSRDETMARWAEQTGFSLEHFGYYEVLALMRFALNMARIGQHMVKIELMDAESNFDVDNFATQTLERALNEMKGGA